MRWFTPTARRALTSDKQQACCKGSLFSVLYFCNIAGDLVCDLEILRECVSVFLYTSGMLMQWRSKLDSKAHFEIEHKVMRGEARSFEDIRLI